MKKKLKIGGVTIAVILILFMVIPFLFSGKIKNTVLNTANKQLNANLEIEQVRLNLFSHFPNATLSLSDVLITGIDNVKGDTLGQAKSIKATINLFKLIRGNYEIIQLKIDNMTIHAKVLPNGETNWNILKEDSAKVKTTDENNPFQLQLDEISLKDCHVIYDDQVSQNKIILSGWNGNISGDLKADESTIKTNSTINEVSFLSKNVPYLNKLKLIANVSFFADLKNMKFTLTKSDLQLNQVKTNIDGSITLVGKDGINFDLGLTAPDAEFKNLLSILPRIYTKDFDHIKASGRVSFDGYIKGLMQAETYPAFNIKLLVEDGMFQYLSLPQSVSGININILVDNKGGSLDSTIIDISRLNFNAGGNPFKSNLLIKTPISDMSLKAHMDGTIDLGAIKNIYPLEENIELSGKIISDLNISTRMSYIEKDEYENIETSGHFKIDNIIIKPDKQPAIQIKEARIDLNHQLINLPSFHLSIGNNDFMITGHLENLLGYIIIDKTLKGQLDIKSTYLNMNDLTAGKSTAKPDNTQSKPFVVPQNIDLIINPVLNNVVYEKTNLSNISGSVVIKGGIITLKNARANTLGGTCRVNGSYNTSHNPSKPILNASVNMDKMAFSETFQSLKTIQKFAPIFDKVIGTYSMELNVSTIIGATFDQTLMSIKGKGFLKTDAIRVKGVEVLDQLAAKVKLPSLSSFATRDVNITFTIENGKVTTSPFDVNIAGTKLTMGGTTGLDKSIDYRASVYFPKVLRIGPVSDIALSIKGSVDNPKIMIDPQLMLKNSITSTKDELISGGIVGKQVKKTGLGLTKDLLKKK